MAQYRKKPVVIEARQFEEVMEIVDYIEVAAQHAVAQGWCEPEASNKERDVVLAGAISKPVARLVQAWHDTAAAHHRNEEYYRGLVIKIGEMLGSEAYISDDGSVQQDVLCAKVPELVASLAAERVSPTLQGQIAAVYGKLDAEDCAVIDRAWAKQRGYILPIDGTSVLAKAGA